MRHEHHGQGQRGPGHGGIEQRQCEVGRIFDCMQAPQRYQREDPTDNSTKIRKAAPDAGMLHGQSGQQQPQRQVDIPQHPKTGLWRAEQAGQRRTAHHGNQQGPQGHRNGRHGGPQQYRTPPATGQQIQRNGQSGKGGGGMCTDNDRLGAHGNAGGKNLQ